MNLLMKRWENTAFTNTKTVIEVTYEAEQPTKPGLFNSSVKFKIESNFCRSKGFSVCLFISVLVCFEDHWKMTWTQWFFKLLICQAERKATGIFNHSFTSFLLLAQKLVYLSMYDRLTITQKWCQNFLDRVHVTESIVMVGDPLKRIVIYWLA